MKIESCTKNDFNEILRDISDFWGSDRTLHLHQPYLFHEFGHWIVGEVLGNNMMFSLNYVWPKNGHYIDASHEVLVLIGGPAFTILLSVISLLIIEKYSTIYAYPLVIFQMVLRFFSRNFKMLN